MPRPTDGRPHRRGRAPVPRTTSAARLTGAAHKIDFATTFERGTRVLARRPVEILLVVLVATLLQQLPSLAIGDPMTGGMNPDPAFLLVLGLVTLVLSLAVAAFTAAYVSAIALGELGGQERTWQRCLQIALALTLPGAVALLLYGIGIAVGCLLLIVPGLLLGAMLWTLIPALVHDRRGISEAFSRSWNVGRSNLLTLLALFLVVMVVQGGSGWALGRLQLTVEFQPLGVAIVALPQAVVAAWAQSMQAAAFAQGVGLERRSRIDTDVFA